MYAELVLGETATAASTLTLLSGLLTGQQTSLSGVSNIQPPPFSKMVNDLPCSWTQVNLTATELILSSPMRDFPTLKYLRIRCQSNLLLVSGMTGWNVTTSTPINGTTETSVSFPINNWSVLKVWATNRYVVFQTIIAGAITYGLFCLEFTPNYTAIANQNFLVGDYFPSVIHPETRTLQFNMQAIQNGAHTSLLLDNQASGGNQVLKLDCLLTINSGVSGRYLFVGKAIDVSRVSVCPKESLTIGGFEFSVVSGYYDGLTSDYSNFLVRKG